MSWQPDDMPATLAEAADRLAKLACAVTDRAGSAEKRGVGVVDSVRDAWNNGLDPLAWESLRNAAVGAGVGGLAGAGMGLVRKKRDVLGSALTGAALGGIGTGGLTALVGAPKVPGLIERATAEDPAAVQRRLARGDQTMIEHRKAGPVQQIKNLYNGDLPAKEDIGSPDLQADRESENAWRIGGRALSGGARSVARGAVGLATAAGNRDSDAATTIAGVTLGAANAFGGARADRHREQWSRFREGYQSLPAGHPDLKDAKPLYEKAIAHGRGLGGGAAARGRYIGGVAADPTAPGRLAANSMYDRGVAANPLRSRWSAGLRGAGRFGIGYAIPHIPEIVRGGYDWYHSAP